MFYENSEHDVIGSIRFILSNYISINREYQRERERQRQRQRDELRLNMKFGRLYSRNPVNSLSKLVCINDD